MLTKAGVKVLDFGLAKWNGCETDVRIPSAVSLGSAPSTLTQVGTAVGTLPYMAPEQLEGRTADARSDLFALGAIVYEMTTGRRPFEGTGYAALIAAIQSATPAPMTAFSPLTPPALEHVVEGCLAKIMTSGGNRRGMSPESSNGSERGTHNSTDRHITFHRNVSPMPG